MTSLKLQPHSLNSQWEGVIIIVEGFGFDSPRSHGPPPVPASAFSSGCLSQSTNMYIRSTGGSKRPLVRACDWTVGADVGDGDQCVLSVFIRDDAFTESVPRNNNAASGSQHDERAPSRNEHQSPCEHTPEHRYGAAVGRWDYFKPDQCATLTQAKHAALGKKPNCDWQLTVNKGSPLLQKPV